MTPSLVKEQLLRCAYPSRVEENSLNTQPTVLICDDNVYIRREIAAAISENGTVRVRRARSAKEAVNIARKEDVQVAILDCAMSPMDGIQANQQIRKVNPDARIIFLTAYASDSDYRRRAAEAGIRIEQWIDKDMDWLPETVKAVRKALEVKTLASFHGKVERIENGIAYVTLVDSKERMIFATCDTDKLQAEGISEAVDFTLTVEEKNGKVTMNFQPIPRRELSDDEVRQLRQEIWEKLGDDDPNDDD